MQFIDLEEQQKKIRKQLDKRISNVLDHGKYIMGPEVFELEEKLVNYTNSKYCISCSSGTDALLIPLMAKNIGKGDAVFTTPFTYISTAEVIKLLGATPIFIDIYPKTFNINPDLLEPAITNSIEMGLRPKAIIGVDIFGLPARYRKLERICNDNNLFLIEDAAQSFGSSIRGQRACSFGDVATTSFFPAKPLGCYGDGGAIFTNDYQLAEKMKSIRIHGKGTDKYDNVNLGINGRLDTIQAAILLTKLKIFDEEISMRNKVAKYYVKNLSSNLTPQHIPKDYISSWAQFSIIASSAEARSKIVHNFTKNKIPSMIYYRIPLHLQKVFSDLNLKPGSLPVSESIAKKIFSVPMHPYLNISLQDKVLHTLDS